MADLNGKTALITGASSGIGLEAAVKTARMGADVVMVARDLQRGEAALKDVKARSGSEKVRLLLCDFSSQAGVRALAAVYRAENSRLDILVNNAGTICRERILTEDGLEQTFAVNHLGYFLLTNLLLDLLEKSAPSRAVVVSSGGHVRGKIDFENLQYENGGFSAIKSYYRSKLANVLFSNRLSSLLEGKGVTVNSMHPGVVLTNFWSKAPAIPRPIFAVYKLFLISAEQGGDRIVYLATSPEVEGKSGGYYKNNRCIDPSRTAQDEALAARLWEVSATLVRL